MARRSKRALYQAAQEAAGLDPMTPAQIEASRRAIADATMQQGLPNASTVGRVAAELTGVPSMLRGGQQLINSIDSGNPMGAVRGGSEMLLGALPWSAAGRSLARTNPVSTVGGLMAGANVDDAIPGAQAAGPDTPPLPISREQAMAPPPAPPPEPEPEPEPSGMPLWMQRLPGQIANNAEQVGTYLGSLMGEVTGGPDFTPMTKEEWIKQNAASQQREMRNARERATKGIKGVSGREGRRIRQESSDLANSLKSEIDAGYADYVAGLERAKAERENQRFSERNPALTGLLKVGPQIAAGLALGRAGRLHGRELTRRARQISGMRGKARQTAQDELAAMSQQQPSMLPYLAAGVGTSGVAKGATDVADIAMLPEGSPARAQAIAEYTTPEGLAETAQDFALRLGVGGAAALAGRGLGQIRGGQVMPGARQEVRTAAGLPNVAAARLRAQQQRAMEDASRPGMLEGLRRRAPNPPSVAQRSSPALPPPAPELPAPTAPLPAGASRPRPQPSTRTPAFTSAQRRKIAAKFAENNGTITAKELRQISKRVPQERLNEYAAELNRVYRDLGPEGFQAALRLMGGGAAIGLMPDASEMNMLP